jgi:hypothetical protein
MAEPHAYQWDYDRSSWPDNPNGITFSAGVFQWLPKTSGKGLKKSNKIRVNGYVADPDSVYAKAEELCRKFNAEGIKITDPPRWLQKQYSVPKPADLDIERLTDDLTGAQVRSIREQVVKKHLLPEGFIKGQGSTYVREREGQIHLIDFQAGRWSREYTINLGFHYAFLPPFFHARKIKLEEFHLLDCAFDARIGHIIGKSDTWFGYGNDREAIRAILVQNVCDCLKEFARIEEAWADPRQWTSVPRANPGGGWGAEGRGFLAPCITLFLKQAGDIEKRLRRLVQSIHGQRTERMYRILPGVCPACGEGNLVPLFCPRCRRVSAACNDAGCFFRSATNPTEKVPWSGDVWVCVHTKCPHCEKIVQMRRATDAELRAAGMDPEKLSWWPSE